MVLQINGTNVVNTDRSITLGTATPGAPVTGMMRYNSTLPEFQVYDGAAWVPFKKVVGGSAATLYAWGTNSSGQLGDNSTVSKSSPVAVAGAITDWVSAETGTGLRANGTIWAWGVNSGGQIGDNTVVSKSSPVAVIGGIVNWVSASTSGFTLAIRSDGTMWGWGANGFGMIGDGTAAARSSPVSTVGGFTDWIQASAGNIHSLGVRANGTMWAWGSGGYGRLGANSVATRSSPVSVVGGFLDWIQASAGDHSLGVRANGTLWSWGRNNYGKLGDNNGVVGSRSSPVSVVGGFTDWVSASAAISHSLGIRANGTLWAWGSNSNGKLGDNVNGGVLSRSSPVSVIGGFTDWVSVTSSMNVLSGHSVGLRANGTLWAWGSNNYGKLGDGTTTVRSSPVAVVGGFTDWVSVSADGDHTVAIRA